MRDESKFGKGRRLCALALCAALCLGCGTVRDVDPPGSGGAATTSAWSSAGTPKQELPSQPGVIVAGPPGLNLTVGATASADLAERIERAGRECRLAGLPPLVRRLVAETTIVVAHLGAPDA